MLIPIFSRVALVMLLALTSPLGGCSEEAEHSGDGDAGNANDGSGDGGTDDGADGGPADDSTDGEATVDGGGDDSQGDESIPDGGEVDDAGDEHRPDYDPADSFLLIIPPGSSLCSGYSMQRDWRQEVKMMGQIDLVPSQQVLPRTATNQPSELIDAVYFGSATASIEPIAEGSMEAVYQNSAWRYRHTKQYMFSGQPVQVVVTLSIYQDQTGSWPAVVEFDPNDVHLVPTGMLHIGPGADWSDEVQAFGPCSLPQTYQQTVTASTQGGNSFVITLLSGPPYRNEDEPSCDHLGFMQNLCLFVVRADVSISGQQMITEESFQLAYNAVLHNYHQSFFVRLDSPVGDIAAVVIREAHYSGDPPADSVLYLDDDLNEINREELNTYLVDTN